MSLSTRTTPNVLSYLRTYKGKAVLVALNMSSAGQKVTCDLARKDSPAPN